MKHEALFQPFFSLKNHNENRHLKQRGRWCFCNNHSVFLATRFVLNENGNEVLAKPRKAFVLECRRKMCFTQMGIVFIAKNPLKLGLKRHCWKAIKWRASQLVKLEIIHFDIKKIECYANWENKKKSGKKYRTNIFSPFPKPYVSAEQTKGKAHTPSAIKGKRY